MLGIFNQVKFNFTWTHSFKHVLSNIYYLPDYKRGDENILSLKFVQCNSEVKLLSHVWLFVTPWTVAYRLLHPWDFPGKGTGVGCHCLLQRIFLTQGSNPGLPALQANTLPSEPLGKLDVTVQMNTIEYYTVMTYLSIIVIHTGLKKLGLVLGCPESFQRWCLS